MPRTFAEFWPHYLGQHRSRRCRRFHYVGTVGGALCLIASVHSWWLVFAAPVFGYGLSWIGHFVFERNRPASWHSPIHFWWSFLGDWKMLGLALGGRIPAEAERLGITLGE